MRNFVRRLSGVIPPLMPSVTAYRYGASASVINFLTPYTVPVGARFFDVPFRNDHIALQNAVRDLKNPGDILSQFAANPDAPVNFLEACLRALGRCRMAAEEKASLYSDDRFHLLVMSTKNRVADMDTRLLSMTINAISHFQRPSDELLELTQNIADVAVRRENSYSPRNLSSMVHGLSTLGLKDPALIEFFRLESIKLMPDFAPSDLYILLEGFRQWYAATRELVDMIIEKMADEIDRYTSKDVVETLSVLANLGLARGFLIRRLSSLAFENLNQFSPFRLVGLLHSLSNLRFLSEENYNDVVDILRANSNSLVGPSLATLAYSLAMGNCKQHADFILTIIRQWHTTSLKPRGIQASVDICHTILYFQFQDMDDILKECLDDILPATAFLQRPKIWSKMLEIISALQIERKDLNITVPEELQTAMNEKQIQHGERLDSSRIHSDFSAITDSLQGRYQLRMQKNQDAGPYRVELMEEDTKIVFDLDLLVKATNGRMKCRHLRNLGYYPVLMHFWQWRKCRSEADQVLIIKQSLEEPLEAIGRGAAKI